jgi:glycerate kinase
MKKVLLMPNPLKGSLSAGGFCIAASAALKNRAGIKTLPVADGGDGLIEVFKTAYPECREYKIPAQNALGKIKKAPYLILPDKKTCIIETAKICGLAGIKKNELAPLTATSAGVGAVIKAAAKKGAEIFYIGLGGVGCNDGGAGMAAALGFKLIDGNNRPIPSGAAGLLKLTAISGKPQILKNLRFYGLSDVENPLLGPKGSARVYGPQKGAAPADVRVMERGLRNFAAVAKRDLHKNINKPRCGAAGAIAAGIYGFLGARLLKGGPFIFKKLGAAQAVKNCDIVITAEGKLDAQTFYGKAPQLACALARRYKKRLIFICGINEIKNKTALKKRGISEVLELLPLAKNARDSVQNAGKYVTITLKNTDL